VDLVPDSLLKSGSAGSRTRDLWICSQELWLIQPSLINRPILNWPKHFHYSEGIRLSRNSACYRSVMLTAHLRSSAEVQNAWTLASMSTKHRGVRLSHLDCGLPCSPVGSYQHFDPHTTCIFSGEMQFSCVFITWYCIIIP
jgi:hypothetical protein